MLSQAHRENTSCRFFPQDLRKLRFFPQDLRKLRFFPQDLRKLRFFPQDLRKLRFFPLLFHYRRHSAPKSCFTHHLPTMARYVPLREPLSRQNGYFTPQSCRAPPQQRCRAPPLWTPYMARCTSMEEHICLHLP
jgi:hypothetical protein